MLLPSCVILPYRHDPPCLWPAFGGWTRLTPFYRYCRHPCPYLFVSLHGYFCTVTVPEPESLGQGPVCCQLEKVLPMPSRCGPFHSPSHSTPAAHPLAQDERREACEARLPPSEPMFITRSWARPRAKAGTTVMDGLWSLSWRSTRLSGAADTETFPGVVISTVNN